MNIIFSKVRTFFFVNKNIGFSASSLDRIVEVLRNFVRVDFFKNFYVLHIYKEMRCCTTIRRNIFKKILKLADVAHL